MKLYPLISVVTVSLNQGEFIEECIKSVIDQNYPNLEYIIIDGGSTDGTLDVIRKYEKYLKFWVSEKDNGQAHAINKGLLHSNGSIFNWLNSDDYLEPNSLFKIADAFSSQNIHLVAGNVRIFSSVMESVKHNINLSSKGLMLWGNGVGFVQPGVWMLRKHISDVGGIDEKYHYAFDWDLYIRYLYSYDNIIYINDTLVNFRLHEKSKTSSQIEKFSIEENLIIEKIYQDFRFHKLHSHW